MSIFARTMRRHASFHSAGAPPAPPVNQGPTSVSFANATTSLPEDTDTTSAIKLADVVVTDDGLGTNTLSISGDSRFALVGSELFLVAGAAIDYETATSHSCTVTATDDQGAGSAQATFTLTITDVAEATAPDAPTGVAVTVIDNEGPTAITLSNQTTSLAEDTDTTSRIHLADITLTDDGMGTNTVTVDNPSYFEIYQGSLYLVAGASLDYETATSHSCTISAVDSTTNDAAVTQAFTLTVTDVLELSPPDAPTGVAVTVSEDLDPYFSDTVLLIQEDLADESLQGQTLTWGSGVTKTSTSKVGNYAISIAGNGTAARTVLPTDASLHFGTGDFTIEGWFKCGAMDTYGSFINNAFSTSNNSAAVTVFNVGSPYLSGRVRFASNDIANNTLTSTTAVNDNQWHHVAAVRSGNTMMLFVDGGLEGTLTTANEFSISGGHIGDAVGIYANNNDNEWTGLFDGLRITKGVARYTAAFTPSDQPLPRTNGDPEFASVDLLLQDSFTDQSLSGQTVVVSGNAAASTTQVKVGTHSLYFDGSGDWATIANTAMAFGTGPFTVEFWMHWDGTVTGTPWMGVMGAHNSSGGNTGRYGIFMNNGGISHFIQTAFPATTSVSANTWHHIASTRDSSGSCRLFVDGVLASTVTDAGNLVFPQGFRVGNDFQPNRPPFSGYLDAIRITKGVCRYAASFTPPTQEFPN